MIYEINTNNTVLRAYLFFFVVVPFSFYLLQIIPVCNYLTAVCRLEFSLYTCACTGLVSFSQA